MCLSKLYIVIRASSIGIHGIATTCPSGFNAEPLSSKASGGVCLTSREHPMITASLLSLNLTEAVSHVMKRFLQEGQVGEGRTTTALVRLDPQKDCECLRMH